MDLGCLWSNKPLSVQNLVMISPTIKKNRESAQFNGDKWCHFKNKIYNEYF